MIENPNPYQTLPEVASMRAWIEQEVIGRGICPPLVRLAQRYRGEQGSLDWNRLSDEVQIESYRHLALSPDRLLRAVVRDYLQLIADETEGAAPLTRVFVLPDFASNQHYDLFMDDVKIAALQALISTPEGVDTSRKAFQKIAEGKGIPQATLTTILNGGERGQQVIGLNIVEGVADPVYFYGRKIEDQDLVDFPDTRGPRERQKMLSRAPYYAFQVVNLFRSPEISANLNRPRLYARNTQLALGTDLNQYEGVMRNLRK